MPPGVVHEFRTGEKPTIIEEIAYVEYNKHDIERKLLGGDIKEPENIIEEEDTYTTMVNEVRGARSNGN